MRAPFKRVVLAASFVAGAVGGVIIANRPALGALLLIGGLVGTVYSFLSSEKHQDETDLMQETMARLFVASGAGNPYTDLVNRKLSRGGVQYVIPDLERALELNPRDADALAMYTGFGVLHLWLRKVSETTSPPPAFADPGRLEEMIQRGFETGEHRAEFFLAKGMLLDSFKRCQEAQECFKRGSELSPSPYWRLYTCTSYGIEGKFDEALAEIEQGISDGATGPLTDFYYGRCLASVGEFRRAVALFQKVKRCRGLHYQLALPMQEAYQFMWRPFTSAYYQLRAALMVARFSPRRAGRHLVAVVVRCLTPTLVRSTQVITRMAKAVPSTRGSRLARLCELDQPYFSLGNALVAKGQYRAAKRLFARAVERAPLFRSYHNLCTAAILTRDWETAEGACLRLLDISPGHPIATQYLDRIRRRDSSVGRVFQVEGDLTP